jgi:hypothetical protein
MPLTDVTTPPTIPTLLSHGETIATADVTLVRVVFEKDGALALHVAGTGETRLYLAAAPEQRFSAPDDSRGGSEVAPTVDLRDVDGRGSGDRPASPDVKAVLHLTPQDDVAGKLDASGGKPYGSGDLEPVDDVKRPAPNLELATDLSDDLVFSDPGVLTGNGRVNRLHGERNLLPPDGHPDNALPFRYPAGDHLTGVDHGQSADHLVVRPFPLVPVMGSIIHA